MATISDMSVSSRALKCGDSVQVTVTVSFFGAVQGTTVTLSIDAPASFANQTVSVKHGPSPHVHSFTETVQAAKGTVLQPSMIRAHASDGLTTPDDEAVGITIECP